MVVKADQEDERLVLQMLTGNDASDKARAEIQHLREHAEETADTICDHCSKPGTMTESPWVHVCCGECEAKERTI